MARAPCSADALEAWSPRTKGRSEVPMSMFKRSAAAAAVLAVLACGVAGQASAHGSYWSTATADAGLESGGWRTPPRWVQVKDATCRDFGSWPIGDVRRRFQHFRCSTWEQVFGDARYRATRKALNEARTAYKAAVAARADQATLTALKNAFLEAQEIRPRRERHRAARLPRSAPR
jgi:hypothetical protein